MADTPTPAEVTLTDRLREAYSHPEAGRVFSLVGPNGAGKSRCLSGIRDTLSRDDIPCMLWPARRALHLQSGPEDPVPSPGTLDGVWTYFMDRFVKWGNPLDASTVLSALLINIVDSDIKRVDQYKDILYQWSKSQNLGNSLAKPVEPPSIIAIVESTISNILGYKTSLTWTISNPGTPGHHYIVTLTFRKDEHSFDFYGLSDGEKEIVVISMFLIKSDNRKFVFLIGEPETFLNEARAIEIWERLEMQFPQAVFLYATHNLGFATRPTVDKTYVIDMNGISVL